MRFPIAAPVLFLATTVSAAVTDFVLVNTKTGKDIMVLEEGFSVLSLQQHGRDLTIRVETNTPNGVVMMDYDQGSTVRVQGAAPYYLAGEVSATANDLSKLGLHTLQACPIASFKDAGRQVQDTNGCLSRTFTVVQDPGKFDPTIKPPSYDVESFSRADNYGYLYGEFKVNHIVTVALEGPPASETGSTIPGEYRAPSTFADYRCDCTFSGPGGSYTVPGYYGGDGNAANEHSFSGPLWLCHFAPPAKGSWKYDVTFREGTNVAVNGGGNPGSFFDGANGGFEVTDSDKDATDLRTKGRLSVNDGNLQFANGEFLIKVGPDSPTNILSYSGFDGFDDTQEDYSEHESDYKTGDPTWSGGKGKEVMGIINFLAESGVNTMTVTALDTDKNVYPFIHLQNLLAYDISKLAQWRAALEHAQAKGIVPRIKLFGADSDDVLNNGSLGIERELYIREMVARFGALQLLWDVGDDLSASQSSERIALLKDLDPYGTVAMSTTSNGETLSRRLVECGTSAQSVSFDKHDMDVNARTSQALLAAPGVSVSADVSLEDDDAARHALWGSLVGGGSGVQFAVDLDDFHTRSNLWAQSKLAVDFFSNVPFWQMVPSNDLLDSESGAYALASASALVIYKPEGVAEINVTLPGTGEYEVAWFNPREGGDMLESANVRAGSMVSLPVPGDESLDWVVLLTEL